MTKVFDATKFRKSLTKSIQGLGIGFSDPTDWISTGNYALNYLMTSDFNKGIPLGKVTVLAGESGAGKSYIASGNIIKNAQQQGIFVILIDTENALDEQWLQALKVDTSEDKLLKLSMSMVDDVAKTVSEFMKGYKEQPMCGFSAQVVQILTRYEVEFTTENVLDDWDLREGIKEYSSWPTIPQLYVDSKFIGGCDIVMELDRKGELEAVLAQKS